MILVQKSSSTSVRGWEGNDSSIEEYNGTLREYVIEDLELEGKEHIKRMISGEYYDDNGFGIAPGGSEEGGYDYEGEETSISYRIFYPDFEYVLMFFRHLTEDDKKEFLKNI